jgi:hypothetical protein
MANLEQSDSIDDALAGRVSQHLVNEEQTLVAVLEAVRELHLSLRELDGDKLAKALEVETAALRDAEAQQGQRQQFRQEVARELGIAPQDFTLGKLVPRTTGKLQETIVGSRERLSAMSTEVDRLNRQNAAMIQQSLMLMRGIVSRLTRTAGASESYNAGGGRDEAHVGSLLQWGG